jgi:hypothetical protein
MRGLQKLQLDATTAGPLLGGASDLHLGMACKDVLERAQRLQTALAAHQDATEHRS